MGKLLDNLRKKHAADQPKSNRHTVNFLAHKEEIMEALREGWTTKQVWEQMTEDGMTTMSYASLCRLVKKHITLSMDVAHGDSSSVSALRSTSPSPAKMRPASPTKKSKQPERELTEQERLDLLREEAFASVRSTRSAGPLIDKPKTREEENRELFGK